MLGSKGQRKNAVGLLALGDLEGESRNGPKLQHL